MPTRVAIIGLDLVQNDWIRALAALSEQGRIQIVAAGHRNAALARDLGDALKVPVYDDLRRLLVEAQPQVIVMDRPANANLEFLTGCIDGGMGIFSLGPPVRNVSEARTLADHLDLQTALLYVWPRFASSAAWKHTAEADEYVRPFKFAVAEWYARNHVLAKANDQEDDAVRSLSVLAWDAIATFVELIGVPLSVYASIRGNVPTGDSFTDITGSAGLTLRFEDCTVTINLSDRLGPWTREAMILGQSGILRIDEHRYEFSQTDGKIIDTGTTTVPSGMRRAIEELSLFLEHFEAVPSPHRGWMHRMEETAATMEAMLVSQRTGQAESPEKFLALRR